MPPARKKDPVQPEVVGNKFESVFGISEEEEAKLELESKIDSFLNIRCSNDTNTKDGNKVTRKPKAKRKQPPEPMQEGGKKHKNNDDQTVKDKEASKQEKKGAASPKDPAEEKPSSDEEEENDDHLLPPDLKRSHACATPYGRIRTCMCARPKLCREIMWRWARLKEGKYINYFNLPKKQDNKAANTDTRKHANAYREAALRHLLTDKDGNVMKRVVQKNQCHEEVPCTKETTLEKISVVHFHPDVIPLVLGDKLARGHKTDKHRIPIELGDRIGLKEDDKCPTPDSSGDYSYFAVPNYSLEDASADIDRAEAEYKEQSKKFVAENEGVINEMAKNPTKFFMEFHSLKQQNAKAIEDNKELRVVMKNEKSKRAAVEKKNEKLHRGLEMMARRLDQLEMSDKVGQIPLRNAKDIYKDITGKNLEEEGYFSVKPGTNYRIESKSVRWVDPRMDRAVQAKWEDPSLSVEEALRIGGYQFPPIDEATVPQKHINDADGVCILDRKHALKIKIQRRKERYAKETGDDSILEKPPQTDPRMARAAQAMIDDPTLNTEQALRIGGFEFPSLEEGVAQKYIMDSDNVSVAIRKHQVLAKLRRMGVKRSEIKKKSGLDENEADEVEAAQGEGTNAAVTEQSDENEVLNRMTLYESET